MYCNTTPKIKINLFTYRFRRCIVLQISSSLQILGSTDIASRKVKTPYPTLFYGLFHRGSHFGLFPYVCNLFFYLYDFVFITASFMIWDLCFQLCNLLLIFPVVVDSKKERMVDVFSKDQLIILLIVSERIDELSLTCLELLLRLLLILAFPWSYM